MSSNQYLCTLSSFAKEDGEMLEINTKQSGKVSVH